MVKGLLTLFLFTCLQARADGFSITHAPAEPVVTRPDAVDAQGVPVLGPWFAINFFVTNTAGVELTLGVLNFKVGSQTGETADYEIEMQLPPIPPGKTMAAGPYYVQLLPQNPTTDYFVQLNVVGWAGPRHPMNEVREEIVFHTR